MELILLSGYGTFVLLLAQLLDHLLETPRQPVIGHAMTSPAQEPLRVAAGPSPAPAPAPAAWYDRAA
jgi:hypothetical protein